MPNPKEASSLSSPGRIHLLIGPVGAGKSTHAQRLARELPALHLDLDAWMVDLFRPDRPEEGIVPWYVERAARAVGRIWEVARAAARVGTHVVLEIGLLKQKEREHFYARVADSGLELRITVVDADRSLRRERVAARNLAKGDTFSMVVPPEVFELASDLWEPPDATERAAHTIVELRTDP
ncbi:MAG: ATP-binding protein [Polyangiaceae bacterium]